MFIKEINIKKIVAACLVFCLIFSNCLTLFSSISFAESNELGKQQSEYVSNNVQYEAKFVKENEELGYKAEESIEEEKGFLTTKIGKLRGFFSLVFVLEMSTCDIPTTVPTSCWVNPCSNKFKIFSSLSSNESIKFFTTIFTITCSSTLSFDGISNTGTSPSLPSFPAW